MMALFQMLAVWGIDTWQKIKGPEKINIVELGPGRGTLSMDILRVRFFHGFLPITHPLWLENNIYYILHAIDSISPFYV